MHLGRLRSCPTILLIYSFLTLPTKDQTRVIRWLYFSIPAHVLSHCLSFLLCCALFLSYDALRPRLPLVLLQLGAFPFPLIILLCHSWSLQVK